MPLPTSLSPPWGFLLWSNSSDVGVEQNLASSCPVHPRATSLGSPSHLNGAPEPKEGSRSAFNPLSPSPAKDFGHRLPKGESLHHTLN